jgi:hypothetical protein
MLQIIRSPLPAILTNPSALPEKAADLLHQIEQNPHHCYWIVPTGRRRRALPKDWLKRAKNPASLLPAFHTVESFVSQSLNFSLRQRPRISGPERLLRVARAWQETLGRPAGLGMVHQLDRFIRDWQACNMPIPSHTKDTFELVIQRYVTDLDADGRSDRMSSFTALARELEDPESGPNCLFFRPSTIGSPPAHHPAAPPIILFDGFHRLDPIELTLIAALSQRCDVWLWLVGVPGRWSWPTLETATRFLQNKTRQITITDLVPPSTGLSALGRSLFSQTDSAPSSASSLSQIFQMEAPDAAAEVEMAAKRIKADYLASQKSGNPLRLSDFAVVVPNPSYDSLIREIFPGMGLEFNLAGRSLVVSGSRPARVILSALQLTQGQWRHDVLLDFLSQPVIKRLLEDNHLLNELFANRPRTRKRLDYQAWSDSWNKIQENLTAKINFYKNENSPLPDGLSLTREEFVAKQRHRTESFQRLIGSIRTVLAPVAALDHSLASPADSSKPLRGLVQLCGELLRTVKINTWVAPFYSVTQPGEPAIPWQELEKDQQAYHKILGILESLQDIPTNRLPLNSNKRPDALTAFLLALDAESYQIRTEDDAGVQVFEIREIRGLTFRRVFALGLVEGQVPPLPEEGVLAGRRQHYPPLREQLRQRELETAYLFDQLFEAAGEMLVLSRPVLAEDRKTLPSRFLAEVQRQGTLPPLEIPHLIGAWSDLEKHLGLLVASKRDILPIAGQTWPNVPQAQQYQWDQIVSCISDYQIRKKSPQHLIEATPLLNLLFPDDRAFNPSELETYAACPFRFFGTYALKLEERHSDQTRIQYGSLIHRVFQRFYEELRQSRQASPDQPLPPITADHVSRLASLFDEEWQQLADGTLPPDLQTLFHTDQGILDLFVEAIGEIEKEFGNYLNEFVLKTQEGQPVFLGIDQHGRPVLLTGKIDRVDLSRSDPTRLIILDYKTGKAATRKELIDKINDGRMLQLPLYAAALTQIRNEFRGIGGAYVHLHERTENVTKAIVPAGEWLRGGPVPFEPDQARAKAVAMAGDIRVGRFPLSQHDVDQPHVECTWYCSLRHACRHPKGYKTPGY